MDGFTLGPLSFSAGLLTTFAAILALQVSGIYLGRKRGIDIENSLWIIVAVALLTARVVFIARYASLYAASPLSMLDIRDGGFHLKAGIAAGCATAAWLAWRARANQVPLLAATGAGAAVFVLAALVSLALPGPSLRLPDMTLARIEGGSLPLSSLVGKPVVVNLWASWCGPCRREMPVLRQAQLAHPQVTFIFVNQGETPEAIRAYLNGEGVVLDNVVLDARPGLARLFNSRALPATFFFNSKGVLTSRRIGELSAATLAERLQVQQ